MYSSYHKGGGANENVDMFSVMTKIPHRNYNCYRNQHMDSIKQFLYSKETITPIFVGE